MGLCEACSQRLRDADREFITDIQQSAPPWTTRHRTEFG